MLNAILQEYLNLLLLYFVEPCTCFGSLYHLQHSSFRQQGTHSCRFAFDFIFAATAIADFLLLPNQGQLLDLPRNLSPPGIKAKCTRR